LAPDLALGHRRGVEHERVLEMMCDHLGNEWDKSRSHERFDTDLHLIAEPSVAQIAELRRAMDDRDVYTGKN